MDARKKIEVEKSRDTALIKIFYFITEYSDKFANGLEFVNFLSKNMQPRILNEFAHFSPIQIVICHGTRLLLSAMNSGLQIIVLGSVFFLIKKTFS